MWLEIGALLALGLLFWTWAVQPGRTDAPGHLGLEVGTTLVFAFDPNEVHQRLAKWGAPMVSLAGGPYVFTIVNDATMAEEIFVRQAAKVNSRYYGVEAAMLCGFSRSEAVDLGSEDMNGIINCSGPRWRFNRKMAYTKLFTKEKVATFKETMEEETTKIVWYLKEQAKSGTKVDPTQVFSMMALNVITNLAFGLSVYKYGQTPSAQEADVAADIATIFEYMGQKYEVERVIKVLQLLPNAGMPRFSKAVIRFRGYLTARLREREAALKAEPESFRAASLLDTLIRARLEDPEFEEVTERDITTMMIDFCLAGSDTSANTLSFAIAELVNHPQVGEKLRAELDSKVGGRMVTTSDIPEMEYLDAVIHETFRHRCAVPLALPHGVQEEINVGGFRIPPSKWNFVMPNVWAIHHDEAQYANPNEWRPERFVEAPELKKSKYFIPFNCGPRVWQEVDFKSTTGAEVKFGEVYHVSVQPTQYFVTVHERTKHR